MAQTIDAARALLLAGHTDEAERLLRQELPERPARLTLARLANEAGLGAVAMTHARLLTARDASDAEAWSALGMAASLAGHAREARAALERAVALKPGYAAAHRNLAAVLCDAELSEEALASAAAAERAGAASVALARVRARAFIQLDRLAEAESLLVGALVDHRSDSQAHGLLARLRQLRGDADPLVAIREATHAPGATPALRVAYCDALRRLDAGAAEAPLRALLAELGPLPELQGSLATLLVDLGRADEAFAAAVGARASAPGDAAIAEAFVVAAIASGRPDDALPVVEAFRAARPRDHRWTTYRIDVARLRGETRFESWSDPRVVTRAIDLRAPTAGLVDEIAALHRQRAHPLDQSLRNGTQTSRNLLVRPGAEIADLLARFATAVNEYAREVAADVAGLPDHPMAARPKDDFALVGCWSVRLTGGGFHVNHIHPEGRVSSAFYLSAPVETRDVERRSGWLKFGEPRHPVAGLGTTGYAQPLPGRLVLFPSYLWHGTTALVGDEPRLTVAFDALPTSEIR